MRIVLCAALAAFAAGSAYAKDAPNAQESSTNAVQEAKPARSVYVCDNSALTRRGFAREFGAVEYVTAAEAKAKGQSWSAPKCVTRSEARRLQKALAAR